MEALANDNRVLNDATQQFLGMTKKVRDAWEAVGGDAVSIATNLGAHHYRYGCGHPEIYRKLAGVEHAARCIRIVGGTQARRAAIMAAVLYGRCMFFLAQRHMQKVRRVMRTALGDHHL